MSLSDLSSSFSKWLINYNSDLFKLEYVLGSAVLTTNYEHFDKELIKLYNFLIETDRLDIEDLLQTPVSTSDLYKISCILNKRVSNIIQDFISKKQLSSYLENFL